MKKRTGLILLFVGVAMVATGIAGSVSDPWLAVIMIGGFLVGFSMPDKPIQKKD